MVFFLFSVMILLISLPLIFHLKSKKTESGCKLPPGKTGWPIIGESLEFNSTGLKGVPQKFVLDRMAKFSSDVFTTSLLGETTAVFCGSAGNKFLFSNENKLVNVWFPSSIDKIFPKTSDSRKESAKTYRTCLKGFLRPEALQGYIGVMDSVAKRHLETHWDNKNQVTVGPLVKDFTFLLACKLLLSLDDPKKVEDMANSVALIASGLFSIPIDLPGTQLNCAIKASDLLRVNVHSIVKQRKLDLEEDRASPTQDIMSQMLVTSNENGVFMNEMDIAENLIGMLIGGHETLNAAITFLIKYLAEYPHVYDQVYTEQIEIAKSKGPGELLNWEDVHNMKYSWSVVCEVLRLAPPFQGTFRESITDFTYAGFLIPKGLKLYWSTHSTHRNADYFPNPDKFDPSRFEGNGPAPYTFTTFGGGPRMCPGKEYSRLKILVFLHNVVRKYKWEKLIHNEKTIVDPLPRPEKGLPIRLQTHSYS